MTDHDIDDLLFEDAIPSLAQECRLDETSAMRYRFLAKRDRDRCIEAERLLDDWKAHAHGAWCTFQTNTIGMSAFDGQLQ